MPAKPNPQTTILIFFNVKSPRLYIVRIVIIIKNNKIEWSFYE